MDELVPGHPKHAIPHRRRLVVPPTVTLEVLHPRVPAPTIGLEDHHPRTDYAVDAFVQGRPRCWRLPLDPGTVAHEGHSVPEQPLELAFRGSPAGCRPLVDERAKQPDAGTTGCLPG